MKQYTLNGGNFGGQVVDLPEGSTKIAIIAPDGVAWCYDAALNPKTTTADFVGCDVAGFEARSEGVMIVAAD